MVPSVLQDVKSVASNKLFISVAMGVSISQLENVSLNWMNLKWIQSFSLLIHYQLLPNDARVIRVMPNTPALVNQGCSVFVRGTNATQKDVEITQKLFEAIGTCEEITESLMDPVTALSGSGPAYVFLMIEALADGGVKMGTFS